MIDFTTIPMHEPIPEVKALNYEKNSLYETNKALKKSIRIIVVGMLVTIGVHLYLRKRKNDAERKL